MNILQIFGYLGKDCEKRVMPNGTVLYIISVGVKSKKGKEESTNWYRVNLWGDKWEKLAPHLKKGSSVIVNGEFFPSQYTNKEGGIVMNLDINADSVKFSPFGKPEEKKQEYVKPASTAPSVHQPAEQQFEQDDLPF